jgi:replicative DNA helicase
MIEIDTVNESNDIKNALFDSDEFSCRVLKYMARFDTTLQGARDAKVKPQDFQSGLKGTKLYQELAKLIFEFKVAPIDISTFNIYYKAKEEKGSFKNYHSVNIDEAVVEIFEGEVTEADRLNTEAMLTDFVVRRREKKVLEDKKQNAEWVRNELNQIHDERVSISVSKDAEFISPFTEFVSTTQRPVIKMGMGIMDSKGGSIGPEECGLIIGHSGTGKTAVASYMMRGVALNGRKVLYISAEEPARNIVNRWYSQTFNMNYTDLHRGEFDTERLKREAWDSLDDDRRAQLSRLNIVDVRSVYPLNRRAIEEILERKADAGFIPDVVCIDQMDYLRPMKSVAKNTGKWQEYEYIAFDCDTLSQYKIGGTEKIALWVLHQATGDMQWDFTYNDIAGFKGIVKPFDLAVGIGREDRESNHINLFSLKVRHSEHFRSPQFADFAHMSFKEDLSYKPKAVRDKEEKKFSKAKKAVKPAEEVEAAE